MLNHLFVAADHKRCPQGLYIYGTVGRGKSFLMDGFYLNLPRTDKLRVHFHGFMRHFHADMKKHEGMKDALEHVATKLAERYRLICFDEFHVSDIADAMILSGILDVLLEKNTVIVATSNYAPEDLYPNGLARDRFLPTIDLINAKFAVHNLDGDTDYRLRILDKAGLYYFPNDKPNKKKFADLFTNLSLGMELTPWFNLGSRKMPAVQRTSDAIWLDFKEICGNNFGQHDYLRLAERFATIFISNVPRLGTETTTEALRRFTWLVDILYDMKVKLILLAEHQLTELFVGEGGESGRTVSRLEEMQSHDYLIKSANYTQLQSLSKSPT